jgi:hypothetical protein
MIGLNYTKAELLPDRIAQQMRSALVEIAEFVEEPPFSNLLTELWALPLELRKDFIREVLLDSSELQRRGVVVPPGLTVQRSAFRDNRPTLFCITKHLPAGLLWDKVTITFDNPKGEPDIRYDELAS